MTDVGEEVDLSPASKTGQLPTLILIVALGMVMKTVFFRLGLVCTEQATVPNEDIRFFPKYKCLSYIQEFSPST